MNIETWCVRKSHWSDKISLVPGESKWNDVKTRHPKPHWLVVSTHLKNISQLGWLFPIYQKVKNVPNHQSAKKIWWTFHQLVLYPLSMVHILIVLFTPMPSRSTTHGVSARIISKKWGPNDSLFDHSFKIVQIYVNLKLSIYQFYWTSWTYFQNFPNMSKQIRHLWAFLDIPVWGGKGIKAAPPKSLCFDPENRRFPSFKIGFRTFFLVKHLRKSQVGVKKNWTPAFLLHVILCGKFFHFANPKDIRLKNSWNLSRKCPMPGSSSAKSLLSFSMTRCKKAVPQRGFTCKF